MTDAERGDTGTRRKSFHADDKELQGITRISGCDGSSDERRSSRSVCTNIGEAWRKRRYPAHFISKLSDSEGEAEETRVWIEIALRCKYLTDEEARELDETYDAILGQLVTMISGHEQWTIR